MNTQLTEYLDHLASYHGIRPFLAVESGSRAWGFDSPDSDYDVRFLYCHPHHRYQAVTAVEESITPAIDGLLDFEGWEVRKAARLLRKSNGSLLEWLHSPIVYHSQEDLVTEWRELAQKHFSPYDLSNHYRGLLTGMWKGKLQGQTARPKDYLYALRSVACALWVIEEKLIPPVAFDQAKQILPPSLGSELNELLRLKKETGEAHQGQRFERVDAWLEQQIEQLPDRINQLPKPVFPEAPVNQLIRHSLRKPDSLLVKDFNLSLARKPSHLLLDVVAGSHAFGTNVASSDLDLKGIFHVPSSALLGLDRIDQVSDDRNDETYYELGRFIELLLKNNPTALEILGSPDDCIRYRHPVLNALKPELFLSKLCAKSFGGYAMTQVKKARGLNKKIVNPQPEVRYPLSHFCYVLEDQGSLPLVEWLSCRSIEPEQCGLTAVNHAPNTYALFVQTSSEKADYRGIFSPKDADRLLCSSVAKEAQPVAWMHCNVDSFRAHCKAHREYWKWVEERNESRFATNTEHGRGYDSKNMMHTLRLLDMAYEIATEGKVIVRRPNADELLKVRAGEYPYETLLARAERRLEEVEQAFIESDLPERPSSTMANELLISLREELN